MGRKLQWVYIIINLQSSISRILSHLLLGKLQIFSHLLLINTIFQFDNNLSDVHRLNPCHSRFIGSQHTLAKPASQRFAELMASLFTYLIIFMFYIHINQVEERWIMKSSSLLQNTLIQTFIIIMHHLSDDSKLGFLVCRITKPRLPFLPALPLTCAIIMKACS